MSAQTRSWKTSCTIRKTTLIIHVLPEPDKKDIDTAAGLVSIQIYEAFMPYQFFLTCSLSACLLLSAFQQNY